jgi:hypothetical protein
VDISAGKGPTRDISAATLIWCIHPILCPFLIICT